MDEAEGLAHAINLPVVLKLIVSIPSIRPATMLGSGKVEEIAELIKEGDSNERISFRGSSRITNLSSFTPSSYESAACK